MQEEFWTSNEVAKYLGVSESLVRKWRRLHKGPVAYKLSSRCVRYRVSEVQTFVRAKRDSAR